MFELRRSVIQNTYFGLGLQNHEVNQLDFESREGEL